MKQNKEKRKPKKVIFIIIAFFMIVFVSAAVIRAKSNKPIPPFPGAITLSETYGHMDLYDLTTQSFRGYDLDNSTRFLHNTPYVFSKEHDIYRDNMLTNESEKVFPAQKDQEGFYIEIKNLLPIDEDNFLCSKEGKLVKYCISGKKETVIFDYPYYDLPNQSRRKTFSFEYNNKTDIIYYRDIYNGEILAYDMKTEETKQTGLNGVLPRTSEDGRFLAHFKMVKGSVDFVIFTLSKSYGFLTVYDQTSGESWTVKVYDGVHDFCFSPDGEYIAILGPDYETTSLGTPKKITIYDYKNDESYVIRKNLHEMSFVRLDWVD